MFKKVILAAVVGLGLTGVAAAGEPPAVSDAGTRDVQKLFDRYSKLRDDKKFDEAVKVLDEIVKVAPTNPYPWSEGAWIFNEMGKYDAAVQAAEKALEVNVDHSNGWRELGFALMKLKRHADAHKALTNALERDKRNWSAYDYLADNYEKQGKFAAARETRDNKAREKSKASATVAASPK